MKASELFGVLVKLLGVYLVVTGLQYVSMSVLFLNNSSGRSDIGERLVMLSVSIVPIVAGCALVVWTRWVVTLAFSKGGNQDSTGMSPPELFGVWVKALGVWQIVLAMPELLGAVYRVEPYNNEAEFIRMVFNSFGTVGMRLLIGCFLLFGTNWLIGVTYRTGTTVTEVERNNIEEPAADGNGPTPI